ncbi:MAG: ATP-binding cassette domain-containing protein, partial [Bacilli bacterium]|nr:ATP-binding cassette domain-containing protein [Bacilli bacterium]
MRTLIKASNIGKSYKQGKEKTFVLRHVNLSLPGIGFVGIQGKSGSGKSTLLNLLAGLETPSEGRVYFAGDDLAEMKGKRRSRFHSSDTSFVFQHYNLIEDQDVLFNVSLPLLMAGEKTRKTKEKARKSLIKFGLDGFESRLVSTLSGGEKQRVALARALVNDPLCVFADEPTGAL